MINQFIVNGIIAGSVYTLVAVGFAVIYRTVRFFHFAHGVVFTARAYFTYFFCKNNVLSLKSSYPGYFTSPRRSFARHSRTQP